MLCTYPGPSVVIMGFRPSFFRFFAAEFPLDEAAGEAGPCAGESFCDPFMVLIHEGLLAAMRRWRGLSKQDAARAAERNR
jgi:hypothetical protein